MSVAWSRSRLIVMLAAALAMLLTARLGWWQVERGRAKQALADAIALRAAQAPLPQAELAGTAETAAAQHHRRIELSGRWLNAHTVYLDNRQMNGRPGFYVLTPLLLSDGSAVLVQRGWQPRDLMDRLRVVPPPAVEDAVRFEARVAPPPARLFEFEGPDEGLIRQNLDLEKFATAIGQPLRPLSLLQLSAAQTADSTAGPDGLLRDWPMPAAQVDKHWGYAFQWFALSALIAGLTLWFQILKPRRTRYAA
jgi:surfeit locus 1 family protein